jgi:hypothetical protein
MIWCQENKVLKQNVDLVHYEFETCRRHFNTLKFYPTDDGVHPKTLADSFYKAELFPTFNESLQYCQKLRQDNNLITYGDVLDATQCTNSYKRNKARLYVKFVASSSLFLKALHAHEHTAATAAAEAGPTDKASCRNETENATVGAGDGERIETGRAGDSSKTISQSSSTVDVFSTATVGANPAGAGGGKYDRAPTRRLDSVSEQQTTTQNTNHLSPNLHTDHHLPGAMNQPTLTETEDQATKSSAATGSLRHDAVTANAVETHRKNSNVFSGTIENGRKVLVRLYSNATELITGIFEKPHATSSSAPSGEGGQSKHLSRAPSRQDSRGTRVLNFFSRSYSRAPSFCEPEHPVTKPKTIEEEELLSGKASSRELSKEQDQNQPPQQRLSVGGLSALRKLDSGDNVPPVKSKRASLKIYTNGQFTHAFPARNCKVAAGFEDSPPS